MGLTSPPLNIGRRTMSIKRTKWTEQDEANLVQLKAQGYKVKDIAKIMNRTYSSISTRCGLMSYDTGKTLTSPKSGQKYNQNEIAYIVLNHNKFSSKEIAKNLGRTVGSISGTISRLKKEGLIIEQKQRETLRLEPQQMELISQQEPQKTQEIKPPVNKDNDNLNQQIQDLRSDSKWLASLFIINFIGVVIIAISIL
jgi:transposase